MYDLYVQDLVKKNEIPAAVLLIQKDGEIQFIKNYGSFKNNENNEVKATTETMFDLASLTKIMATLPSILLLHERKELRMEDRVKTYIPDFKYPNIHIKHLLQHNSGLPADLSYKKRNVQRDVFSDVMQARLLYKPGTKVVYSDLGMILLGRIVEKVSGMRFDYFCQKYLYDPWGMENTQFLPELEDINQIATTELFQGEYIHGKVHDEKAHQLGGVSGSAGLFSTAKDVLLYANYWLFPESQSVLSQETMNLVQKDVFQNRGLGFEVWNGRGEELSCGGRWSKGSFGHTGFTGTSLWIDPKEKLSVVFLTNVVHYGRNHRLQMIRKSLHTMIYEMLIRK